jgi:hypothetical protein
MSRPRVYEEDRVVAEFRLPRSLHDALKRAAAERDVPANFLAIRALSDDLERLSGQAETRWMHGRL